MSADEARAAAAQARENWMHEIARRGREARKHRHHTYFRSPGPAWFHAALRRASKRYDFHVLRARIYKPFQRAPFVIVESAHPKRFSRDTPAIQQLLDPRKPRASPPDGWGAYEGFYLEARDIRGDPFLAIFNFWRGDSPGGGQWARSESLYPFPHG